MLLFTNLSILERTFYEWSIMTNHERGDMTSPSFYLSNLPRPTRERVPLIRYWYKRRQFINEFHRFAKRVKMTPQIVKVTYLNRRNRLVPDDKYGWLIAEVNCHHDEPTRGRRGKLVVTTNGDLVWIGNYRLLFPKLSWLQNALRLAEDRGIKQPLPKPTDTEGE